MRPIDKWKEANGPTPCVGQHAVFFPWDDHAGHSPERERLKLEARRICKECPAIIPCAESSTIVIDGRKCCEPGIWAGRDQVERCRASGLPPVPGTGNQYAYIVASRTRRARHG